MTDVELRKLKRTELLEMLIAASRENETLRTQVEELNRKLEDRNIAVSNLGSIAEASLQLNGVFEAAQAAAEQYLENVRNHEQSVQIKTAAAEEEARRSVSDAEARAKYIVDEATQQAEALLNDARQKALLTEQDARMKAESYWATVSQRLEAFYTEHKGLQEMLHMLDGKGGN